MTNSRMGVDELVDSVGLGPVEFPHGATKAGIPIAGSDALTYYVATKSAGDTLASSLPDGATVIVEADESATPVGVKVRYTVAGGLATDPVADTAQGISATGSTTVQGVIDSLDFNALDPRWGIVQKLDNSGQSVRAELQALLDFAAARRDVSTDQVHKARVFAPGAYYWLDGTVYIPQWVDFVCEHSNYQYGTVFRGINGFNSGAGGDLFRLKTNGESFWGGSFIGASFFGANDGSVQYGFNTVNELGANVELQDKAVIDHLAARYLAAGGVRIYGGVPNYMSRFRPYCLNGPGITLVSSGTAHTISHLGEISGDQCNGGLVLYEGMLDSDVLVITALKSEKASPLLAVSLVDSYYNTIRGWKNSGHDGQNNAIRFHNPSGGRVVINGAHHISAYNTKQTCTFSGELFTLPSNTDFVEGGTVRFTTTGTLPSPLVANTDYYWHIESPTTGRIATSPANLAANIYVTPSGGSGTLSVDGGIITAGDLIELTGTITKVPAISFGGAYVRYRPVATGGPEKIGSKPNIISGIPGGDATGGSSPRTVDFPIEQPSGQIIMSDGYAFVGRGSGSASDPIKKTVVLVGDTTPKLTNLNCDAQVQYIGSFPAAVFYETDQAVDNRGSMITASSSGMQFRFFDDSGNATTVFGMNRFSGVPTEVFSNYNFRMADGKTILLGSTTGTRIGTGGDKLAFYGSGPVAKQTVSGSRGGNAALADLLTKLASLGLITDSTSA